MSHVFVIAEAGSSWRFRDNDLENARRIIDAAAKCGASAVKFQWCSDPAKMAARRNAPELVPMYAKYLAWPKEWMITLKLMCEARNVGYMCTAYLAQDIDVIAPHVGRFKVASFEALDREFVDAHPLDRGVIVSCGMNPYARLSDYEHPRVRLLYCVSAYPCPIDEANLARIREETYHFDGSDRPAPRFDGFSDHTLSVLSGALAVAAGARIIEKHVRLHETPQDNPDYGHSLVADESKDGCWDCERHDENTGFHFSEYVANIRQAEQMMGTGEQRVMPCEEANLRYRVKP